MIARVVLNVLATVIVLFGKVLVALRLRSEPSGWRRVLGVGLRNEASKFSLPAFALKVPESSLASDDLNARIAKALVAFLQTEPEARYRLTHGTWVTSRHPSSLFHLVVQHFNPDGSLAAIESHFAPGFGPDDDATRDRTHAVIVAAYNQTRHLPESCRPAALLADIRARSTYQVACAALDILGAVCVSFDQMPDGIARLALPQSCLRRGLGHHFLTFIVRPDAASGTADVWPIVHHVGADGAPWQEAMTRLERAWGAAPVTFPEAGTVLGPHPCFIPGEREVYETISFHDFTPLLALRKKLNAKLAAEIGGDITFGCLLLWQLSREPGFAGTMFAATLEVPASGSHERDVDFVVLKPADFGTGDDAALVAFAREFNRRVADARVRKSPLRQTYKDAELLPAWLHRKLLEYSPERVRHELGDVGVSIVRDARVIVGTIPDIGFDGGFVAIGNLSLPTASGRVVGAVSVKATEAIARQYPAVIRRVLERCKDA